MDEIMLFFAKKRTVYRRAFFSIALLVASLIGIWRCQLGPESKVEQFASFDQMYDSLSKYDSVVIIMKDGSGNFLDTVFNGQVDSHEKLRQLPVRGWDGKKSQILISGFNEGTLVYQIEKKFDGTSNETDANIYLVIPGTTLACAVRELTMIEGDSLGIPVVTVSPAILNDKTVLWKSNDSSLVQVGPGFVKARGRGVATLIAQLRSDTTRIIRISVTVLADKRIPDSLYVEPDTLRLAAEGASGRLLIRVSPSSTDADVTWKVADTSIATVSLQGIAQGHKAGKTWVLALSKLKNSVTDSSLLLVSDPVPVEKVRFVSNPLTIYVGGAAVTLAADVIPVQANPEILFSLADSVIAMLKDNKVIGKSEGRTRIVARSKAYPNIADTLLLTVLTGHPVERVVISDKAVGPAYVGGPMVHFAASVLPADAPQQIQWKTQEGSIAVIDSSGMVRGLIPGHVKIYAISLADSSKKDSVDLLVKRDMPQLSVGGDTTLSVGQTMVVHPTVKEESGKLVVFRWDLNGDGAWDDSSTMLKDLSQKYDEEKETNARFYVRDNEGNDTLVYKKVKAVLGPIIQILSPANNSYTRVTPAKVVWTLNREPQDTLPMEALHEGANILTRKAKDVTGTEFSATITVYYDTIPPGRPAVHGPAIVNTSLPTWTWASAGNGAGIFRFGLDAETFTGAETKDTIYTPSTDLKEGSHTLFVQERDAAGNWSASGRFAIRIDQSPPAGPTVRVLTPSPTNVRRPKFAWATGGGGGGGGYQYRIDNPDMTSGTTSTLDTEFFPDADLSNGPHTIYVRESDSAGNWSNAGSAYVVIDTIPPGMPNVSVVPGSPTNNTRPTWSWTSGGGGTGVYRYKLDDQNLNAGATQIAVASFQPSGSNALSEGAHTLYVQESDSAGNWSASTGSKAIVVDLTGPNKPSINQNSPLSPINSLRPTMSWASGGGEGSGTYLWKWDSNDLSTGSTTVSGTSAAPLSDLSEGLHTFYLQELDAAGNLSPTASRALYCMKTGQVGGIVSSSAGVATNTVVSMSGAIYVYNGVDDVMRLNGPTWQSISQGSDFSSGTRGTTLFLNPESGQPNIGYGIRYPSPEINVSSYSGSGSTWGQLWPLSLNGSFYPGFAMGRYGQPFVASYSNDDSVVRISRYSNSTKWQSAFPDVKVDWYSYGDGRLTFAMDTVNNVPYIHLRSGYQTGQFIAMAYRGGVWKNLDTTGLASVNLYQLKIMTSPSGVLYLVQSEEDGGNSKIVLYRYNDATSAWSRVGGSAIVGSVDSQQPAVAFNSSGNPVVALNHGNVVEVYGLVGMTWIKMGNAGGVGNPISLAVGLNDEVYVTSGTANLVTFKVGFTP
jgi:hypothetical protein